jgi:flagellar biosynthesis chaperone FliJ
MYALFHKKLRTQRPSGAASHTVKCLEQLRKRREEKFQREQAMGEQKFADEVARRKFATAASRKKHS